MEDRKAELLELIHNEYQYYCSIPESEPKKKGDKKQFINGLMTASRVIGISYDELNKIVQTNPNASLSEEDELLDVPTFVRNKMKIHGTVLSER